MCRIMVCVSLFVLRACVTYCSMFGASIFCLCSKFYVCIELHVLRSRFNTFFGICERFGLLISTLPYMYAVVIGQRIASRHGRDSCFSIIC